MIEGVVLTKKNIYKDERGEIFHMMRNDDPIFEKFGEVYFSSVFKNQVKAWHLHKKMTLNYVAVVGKVKFALYDDRKESKTFGQLQEIDLSSENYYLLSVPPLVWNGFKSADNNTAIISNCSDIPHDPDEIIRKDYQDPYFPYDWN